MTFAKHDISESRNQSLDLKEIYINLRKVLGVAYSQKSDEIYITLYNT